VDARDFCFWLQGFFEIAEAQGGVWNESTRVINSGQIDCIQAHLNLAFKHDIDPQINKGLSEVEVTALDTIHESYKDKIEHMLEKQNKVFAESVVHLHSKKNRSDELMRC